MKNTKIVFATNNKNKIKEIQNLLPENFQILSLEDIHCHKEIPETGKTLHQNALLKANYVYQTYHMNVFADDTGLEVESLNNEPGVYSARYAGESKNDSENIKLLLKKLENTNRRKAQFRTVIALILNGEKHIFEGIVKGNITNQPHGENGFGYDSIFKPEHQEKTFAQMTLEQKNEISHRAIAFQKLIDFLTKK